MPERRRKPAPSAQRTVLLELQYIRRTSIYQFTAVFITNKFLFKKPIHSSNIQDSHLRSRSTLVAQQFGQLLSSIPNILFPCASLSYVDALELGLYSDLRWASGDLLPPSKG